jgi:hypothetical protein
LREPFLFEGPAIHQHSLVNVESTVIAAGALQSGETLAWSGPIDLDGIGGTVVLAAAEGVDGISRGFAVTPDGSVVSTEVLRDREYVRLHDRFGKLAPELFEQQAALNDEDEIPVAIMVRGDWIQYEPPGVGPDVQAGPGELRDYVSAQRAAQRERIDASKAPLRQLLSDVGLAESTNLGAIPMVTLSAPVWFLRSTALNELDSVSAVFSSAPGSEELLGYAGHASMNEAALTGGPASSTSGFGNTPTIRTATSARLRTTIRDTGPG